MILTCLMNNFFDLHLCNSLGLPRSNVYLKLLVINYVSLSISQAFHVNSQCIALQNNMSEKSLIITPVEIYIQKIIYSILFTYHLFYFCIYEICYVVTRKEQIYGAIGKIFRGMGMRKYWKRYLPLETIQIMYFSTVVPLSYGCSVI